MVGVMSDFEGPTDLAFNRELIADPKASARESQAASWLFVCGEEFATMDGGMSYASVQAVLGRAADGAPFSGTDELKAWVAHGLDELA
jgi:hypothetical protein